MLMTPETWETEVIRKSIYIDHPNHLHYEWHAILWKHLLDMSRMIPLVGLFPSSFSFSLVANLVILPWEPKHQDETQHLNTSDNVKMELKHVFL